MSTPSDSKKFPPVWWKKTIRDIESTIVALSGRFNEPGVVLGFEVEDEKKTGVYLRAADGTVRLVSTDNDVELPPVGAKLKFTEEGDGQTVEPENAPHFHDFVAAVIYERVKLVPKIWLHKVTKKMVAGEPVTMSEDLRPFPEWVRLPSEKKKNKALIDLLYRATKLEGLRGLERFNDYAS